MPVLKIVTWNIENFGRLLERRAQGNLTASERARLEAIAREIQSLSPDILCIVEGPKPARLPDFCADELGGEWTPVLRAASDPYHIGAGRTGPQYMLFIARPSIAAACRLVPVSHWRTMTEQASRRIFRESGGLFNKDPEPYVHRKDWAVSHPYFKPPEAIMGADPSIVRHKHHRHPQLLAFDLHDESTGERTRVELVGLHLKSKINQAKWQEELTASRDHVREAIEARIKLTTEALNVRYFLEERFDQNADCAIFLMGDLNDGPGKDFWEEIFLFHDLVANLQGDVFLARRFLNHALFDFPDEHRWSAEFRDTYNPNGPDIRVLIDHILFTQRLVRADARKHLWVDGGTGAVEHEVHAAVNATLPASARTSDHRPVSCRVTVAEGLRFVAPAA